MRREREGEKSKEDISTNITSNHYADGNDITTLSINNTTLLPPQAHYIQ
jgi:hypothetical protein